MTPKECLWVDVEISTYKGSSSAYFCTHTFTPFQLHQERGPASPQTPGFKQVQGNQQLPHKESSASPLLAVYVLAVLEKCVSLF